MRASFYRSRGCSAFHFAEAVQVGLVPVYVHDVYDVNDDVPWVPYKDMVPVHVHDEVMADSRGRFVPRGMARDSTHGTGAGPRVRRCYSGYHTRISLRSLVTC